MVSNAQNQIAEDPKSRGCQVAHLEDFDQDSPGGIGRGLPDGLVLGLFPQCLDGLHGCVGIEDQQQADECNGSTDQRSHSDKHVADSLELVVLVIGMMHVSQSPGFQIRLEKLDFIDPVPKDQAKKSVAEFMDGGPQPAGDQYTFPTKPFGQSNLNEPFDLMDDQCKEHERH